jgi:hypothetical protein
MRRNALSAPQRNSLHEATISKVDCLTVLFKAVNHHGMVQRRKKTPQPSTFVHHSPCLRQCVSDELSKNASVHDLTAQLHLGDEWQTQSARTLLARPHDLGFAPCPPPFWEPIVGYSEGLVVPYVLPNCAYVMHGGTFCLVQSFCGFTASGSRNL